MSVVERPPVYGAPVAPGEVRPGRAAPPEELRLAGAHDPAAGGGHPRRQGGAAAPGPLRRGDGLRRRPARGRPLVRGGGGDLPARGRPRRRPRGRAGEPRARGADHLRARRAGGAGRRAALDRLDPARARGGRRRVVLGTAAFTDPDLLDEALERLHLAHPGGSRRARRHGLGGGLDARDSDARRGRHPADAGAGRHAVRVHERRPRRDARGAGPRRGEARLRGRARPLPLLGRDRLDRGPARAARCGC